MSENKSNSDNLKNALCYVPFVAIIFFFAESKKSDELMKHIKYGFSLFVGYIVLNIFLSWAIGGVLFLLYIGIVAFLGYKVYSGEEVEIDYIDKLEGKISEGFANQETNTKKSK